MLRTLVRRPSPAMIIALIALFIALGGPAEGARWLEGTRIRPSSISGRQVADRSLGVRDLSPEARATLQRTPGRSITSAQIVDGQVGSDDISPGAVGPAKLALDSVRPEHILNGGIGPAELAPNSVDAEKIANDAVRASEIADASIDSGEIVDGGLRAGDVGSFSGVATAGFVDIPAGQCREATITAVPNSGSQNIDDDVVIASPAEPWPAQVSLSARPQGDSQILLTACNGGLAPTGALSNKKVHYVTFDLLP